MGDNRSQSRSHQARAVRSIVSPSPTLPLSPGLVISNSSHQASIPLSQDGGASVPHTAFRSDQVLTGLQSPLTAMPSASDQTPRIFFSSSDQNFPDFDPFSFPHADSLQGDSQYSLAASTSGPSRYLDPESSSVDINGVTSHQPGPLDAPWTHLSATEGSASPLPGDNQPGELDMPSQHLATPTRGRAHSTASGHESFRDSAYGTGSRSAKSQQEIESMTGGLTENMNSRFTYTPTSHPHQMMGYPSSHSSTITPGYTSNPPPSESGQSINAQQPRTRPASLNCKECDFVGKTRSDLKKHRARHEREHKCHVQECNRRNKGFATANDLDRHLKSVHGINNRKSKYWKCFADGCTKANKEWPRQDNFKQHLQKMHPDRNVAELLRLSDEWYDQQEHQETAEETQPLHNQNTTITSAPAMAVSPPYQDLQGGFPTLWSNPNTMPVASQMGRSVSFNNNMVDPSLSAASPTRLAPPQRRRLSGTGSASVPQRPPLHVINTSNLMIPGMPMQRTMSQSTHPQAQDTSQLQANFNQVVNYQMFSNTPWPGFQQPAAASRMTVPAKYGKLKGAHTIDVPDLDSNRMADFSSQDVQPTVQDLGGRPEDLLNFIGSSTAAESLPAPSQHQGYQINIFPPEDESKTQKSKRQKLLEDEVYSFLEEHNSKAEKVGQTLSDQEFINRFRQCIQNFDTLTTGGSSAVSRATGATRSEATTGITCPATHGTYHVCPVCKKIKSRASELKKHMQRHSKPFGCTFDGCSKTFGSKNDWKRHEQSQHEQQECWRCATCYEVFFHSQDYYVTHMRQEHSIHRAEEHARHHRIARNYQGQFWCGFCNQIMVHNKSGVEAINYRFDHIASHFNKEKKSSKEWIELGGKGQTKQAIATELKESHNITEEEEDDPLESPQTVTDSTQSSSSQHSESSPEQQILSHHSSPSTTQRSQNAPPPHQQRSEMTFMRPSQMMMSSAINMTMTSLAKNREENASRSQRRHQHGRVEVPADFIICCQCGEPSNHYITPTCMHPCLHRFCTQCQYGVASSRE